MQTCIETSTAMTTRHTALIACANMLQELMPLGSDDQAQTAALVIQEAEQALALPDFPHDFEFTIEGPDGIPLHPEAYPDLQAAIEAAAAFPLRYAHQGYYKTARMEQLDLAVLPKCLTLHAIPKPPRTGIKGMPERSHTPTPCSNPTSSPPHRCPLHHVRTP
jgi:hypothetical protein